MLFFCPLHGEQGVYKLCPHLEKKASSGSLQKGEFVLIRVRGFLLGNDTLIGHYYFCPDCIEKYHLPVDKKVVDPREYREALEGMKLFCQSCFDELIKRA